MRLPPWMWRVIRSRKTRMVLACSPFALCALVAVSYPICGWIGHWQLKRHVAELERAGYAVDLEKYYVPASSPDRDVFQHPAMIREMEDPKVVALWEKEPRMPGLVRSRPGTRPEFATATDVKAWFAPPESDEKQAAQRLLGELREAIERMEELRPALERPEAAWQVRWMETEFSQGKKLPDAASSMFRLRSLMRFQSELVPLYLAAGDSAAASACVASMNDACRHFLEARPSIVSVLLADGTTGEIEKCVWEGVVRGAWTDEQLALFEARLAALDPQKSASRSFRGEVAFARWNSQIISGEVADTRSKHDLHLTEGWEWDRERIGKRIRAIWRGIRPQGIDLMKWVEGERTFISQLSTHDGSARTRFTSDDLVFFRHQHAASPLGCFAYGGGMESEQEDLDARAWQQLENFTVTVLRMETRIAFTRAGIALERYRLANGEIPRSLNALIPRYLPALPSDPFDGKSLRYRRQADGSPHLWSVGADGIDEGGLPHASRYQKGDPVWITRPIPGFTKKDFSR